MQIGQSKTKSEIEFELYREGLLKEGQRLASYVRLYRRLHERKADRLDEMNLAPAFFTIVIDALSSALVIWVEKLFSKKSERGLVNFLEVCKNNIDIFDSKELHRRRNFPDGHWALCKQPITIQIIQEDREKVEKLESFGSFKLRRDKFCAHFDKEYFLDRERLSEDAPLRWLDLEEPLKIMNEIIDRYSAAYDSNSFSLLLSNVNDVDYLLDFLREARERRTEELHREDERIESEK